MHLSRQPSPTRWQRAPARRPRWRSGWALPSLLALGAILAARPALADQAAALATRLAGLRGDVERLSSELSDKHQSLQDQLRSYARQKAELELELQRERTRLQKTRAGMAEKQKQIAAEQAAGDSLRPLFDRKLAEVRAYVAGTLPFRAGERAAELDKIEEQLKSGLLTPQRALMRLWTFMEDEFRLTRENGLYRQTIRLGSGAGAQTQLADVVRVGMVALYFRTSDDRVGFAARDGEGWSYREVSDKEGRRQVLDLFDSFKKQIRVGYFELPNGLQVQP